MKFGCVITPRDYAAADHAGYDYVELSGRMLQAMPQAQYRDMQAILASGRIPCFGLNAYCPPEIVIAGPGFDAKAAKVYAEKLLPRAAELGVKVVGVGSPNSRNLPEGFSDKQAFLQALAFFDVTAQVFASAGITVCVEALGLCYCNFINTLAQACEIVRQVSKPNLKAVIDFYNMEHNKEADIPLDMYIADIAHAHISDDAGDPLKRWFLRQDKRDIHIARLKRLYKAGYTGNITAEIDLPLEEKAAEETLEIFKTAAGNPPKQQEEEPWLENHKEK